MSRQSHGGGRRRRRRGQRGRQIFEQLLLFGFACEAKVGDFALTAEQQFRQLVVELGTFFQIVLHLHVDVVRRG